MLIRDYVEVPSSDGERVQPLYIPRFWSSTPEEELPNVPDRLGWEDYEEYVFNIIVGAYGSERVVRDAKIRGRYSGRIRQIDILVRPSDGFGVSMMIDCKHYGKKIGVKVVEELVGMMSDVGVDKCLIVTNEGFTKPGYNRAVQSPDEVELDVVGMDLIDEWPETEHLGFLIHRNDCGALVSAPVGWTAYQSVSNDSLGMMRPIGLTLAEAGDLRRWMYVNLIPRSVGGSPGPAGISEMIEMQAADYNRRYDLSPQLDDTNPFDLGVKNMVRYYEIPKIFGGKEVENLQYSIFLEFINSVFYAVLITKDVFKERDYRSLGELARNVVSGHRVPPEFGNVFTPLEHSCEAKSTSAYSE